MDLSNLKGLLDTDPSDNIDVSDDDLEDELNAILSGKTVGTKAKQTASSSAPNVKRIKQNDQKVSKIQNTSKPNKKSNETQMNFSDDLLNIDKLGIIEDFEEDDNDIDEDDEDLLSEINAIASRPTTQKVNKISEYKTPRIDYDIPLNVGIQEKKSPNNVFIPQSTDGRKREEIPTRSSPQKSVHPNFLPTFSPNENIRTFSKQFDNIPAVSMTTETKSEVPRLNTLKDEYKKAALIAKKAGQQTTALSHIRTAKQIEGLIKALEEGQTVDLSQLPPPPTTVINSIASNSSQSTAESQPTAQTDQNPEIGFDIDVQNVELTTEDAKKFFNAPPPPNSVMEALEQRLGKFKSTLEAANQENNASKARRLGRITKQYETAIKNVKKGKLLNIDELNELPTPPGFGPIPVPDDKKPEDIAKPQPKPESIQTPPKPKIQTKPVESEGIPPNKSPQSAAKPQNAVIDTTPPRSERPVLKRASSSANKQLNYLLERQRLFKEAALESKQKGDIQQAKEYLRAAKGFEPLIEATQNGLPIDATSIPTPPQMSEDFVIVSHPDTSESEDLEKEEMFRKIEVELQNQIEMCKRNKEYFLQLGDISTSSKFEKYAIDSRKELDLLVFRWKNGQKLPNIKYETRTFSVVICNPEVSTNEVSVEVVKALDIPAKPEVDTYVRLEFPFPNDSHQSARTKTVKNSINPVFNQTFKFEIDRKSRQLPRIFKRHPLKLELMSKGGFLRNDTLIGTSLIKLVDLENKCTIHDTFELTEGRKVVGGRIEAKVRIKEPLLSKQVEEVKEKWLSFV